MIDHNQILIYVHAHIGTLLKLLTNFWWLLGNMASLGTKVLNSSSPGGKELYHTLRVLHHQGAAVHLSDQEVTGSDCKTPWSISSK